MEHNTTNTALDDATLIGIRIACIAAFLSWTAFSILGVIALWQHLWS